MMEISTLSKDTLKIRGKHASLVVDPKTDIVKTTADAVLLLTETEVALSRVEGWRLLIDGFGEYEVSDVRISAFGDSRYLAYDLRLDGLELLLTKTQSLEYLKDTMKDYHLVILHTSSSINQSILTSLSPHVVVLYGEQADEKAKLVEASILTERKYQTTVEKLPQELTVVVLKQ